MMQRLLLFLFFLLPAMPVLAQDTIFRYDHTRIVCQVVSVGEHEIVYHRKNDQKGYNRTIRMRVVSSVHYFSGEVKNFDRDAYLRKQAEQNDNRKAEQRQSRHDKELKPLNIDSNAYHSVSLNMFDLPFGVFTFNYQYDFKGGYLGIRVPVSSGAGVLGGTWRNSTQSRGGADYFSYNKIFSTGVDLLFYPGGAKEMYRFYLGPTFEYGSSHTYRSVYHPNSYPPYSYDPVVTSYTGGGFKVGASYYPHPNITVGADFSFGMVNTLDYGSLNVLARLGLLMGWRF